MARRKIHFGSLKEAKKYHASLIGYEKDSMRIYRRHKRGCKPHYVVCNDLEWLHFYGG